MTHPSLTASTAIPTSTEVDVTVRLSWPLLRDVTRRWPDRTLDEKVSNALMLACAWHDHGDTDDDADPPR